jgi:hypothetical protein
VKHEHIACENHTCGCDWGKKASDGESQLLASQRFKIRSVPVTASSTQLVAHTSLALAASQTI